MSYKCLPEFICSIGLISTLGRQRSIMSLVLVPCPALVTEEEVEGQEEGILRMFALLELISAGPEASTI